jgi:hypothetical protein
MKKHLIMAAAAVFFTVPSFSTVSFAAPPDRSDDIDRRSIEHITTITNARISALKSGLKLNSTQDKSWPELENALHDVEKSRAERMAKWHEKNKGRQEKIDVLDNLFFKAKSLSARGNELEKIASSAKPLYDSLDNGQKLRFGILLNDVFRYPAHQWYWDMQANEQSVTSIN